MQIRRLSGEQTTMTLVSSFWYRLRNRLRFRLATQEVLDRLAPTGITIDPYVVVDEPILVRPNAEELDEGPEIRQLGADEAPLIAGMDERPRKESRIRELMSRATCIAVTQDDEPLAYSWYTCDHFWGLAGMHVICDLPPEWAYLFDMYVRPKARGRRMAVALRHHIHKLLAAQGFRLAAVSAWSSTGPAGGSRRNWARTMWSCACFCD